MGSPPGVDADQLQLRNRQHEIVADLGRRALSGAEPDWLMHDAAAALAETLDLAYAGVFELAADEQRLVLREGVGWREDEGQAGGPAEPEHLGEVVLGEGEPVVFGEGDRPVPLSDRLVRHEVTSGIAVPLAPAGEPRGILAAYGREDRSFTDADVAFVRSVANVLASSLETETAPTGEAETRHEVEHQESERYRRKLDDVVAAPQLDGDEKIQRLLELGCERLGVENGHLVRIDVETGRHEIVQAAGTTLVEAGSVTDLEETYCRETMGSGDVMEVPNAPEGGWTGDPADERWGIGCYVGTEIRVEGEPWGTLCFVNEEPIDQPLTEAQRAFVALVGRRIGQEMGRREHTQRRNRERELEESERRHRALVENFPDGAVAMFDEHMRYTVAGGELLEELDLTGDELVGQTVHGVHRPDVADQLVPRYEATLEGEGGELEIGGDGLRPLAVQTIPVRDVEGEVYAGMVVFRDVSEQRRLEAEFEEMFDRITDAFYALDEDFRFTHVNDAAAEFLQRPHKELLGEELWELFPEAADIPEVWDAFHRAMEEQETTGYELYYEPLDLWVDATIYPSESGVSVYFQDVRERKERERQLRKSEAKFRRLAENLSEIVWMSSEDPTELLYINPAFEEVWGRDREELYEETLSFLDDVHPEDRDRVREAYTSLPDGEYDEEFRVVQPDGDVRWVRTAAVSVEDDEGEVFRIVGIAEDVTERREFRARLAESERQHRTLVENFPNGAVGLFDHDLRYTVVGGQLFDDLGLDPDDIVGQSVLERYPRDVLDVAEPRFRAALEGEASRFEIAFHDRQLLAHTIPVRSEEDEVAAGMLVVQDITDRKRAEEELRESEELYRTLAENFPNGGIGVFDEDLRYTLVEGTMWDDIEPDAEDLEGRGVREALPDGTADDVEPIFRAALEGEKGSVVSQLGGRTYRVWATPLRGAEGEVTGGLSFAVDVTDQLERQRELEESRRRYQTLVENFPNGAVTLVDEDIIYRMVGGTPPRGVDDTTDAIQGRPVAEAMPDPLAEELVPHYEAAFEGEASTLEHELQGRVYRFRVVPVRDEDGQVFAAMGMSQDVTEAKERERRLEESNERLEQFAYAASHDLQEPLRMVSSYLQLIEARYGEHLDEEGREFFSYAVDGAQRMRAMIKSLLQYSRIRTEGQPLEPTDSRAVLDDVLSDLQLRIEETDAEVTADRLPRVRADPNQLGQVFRNLISNALKYSGDEPPRVHVGAEPTDGKWRFSIQDEGVGIADEHADKIFEVFRRLESSDDGIGIGLAICEQIVDRHGGRMWVDSTPGEGSTFHFTMSALDEDADESTSRGGRFVREG